MKKLIVNDKFNHKKLSSFFMSSFSDLPRSVFYKLLRKKDIRINDKRISEDITVYSGDEVLVFLPDIQTHREFPIAYEDDNILVIDKPIGIAVTNEDNSLADYLKKNYTYIEPCHRLDRNTSGLVIFAKNEEALNILFNCFKHHEIEKHYACIVVGSMPKKKDNLNAFLFKDSKKSLVYISDVKKKGYLPITTNYQVLAYSSKHNLSLLDIQIPTGRTHQIRAHLAHIGHPVLGDGKYGINDINKKFKLKAQALHAYKIKFNLSKSDLLEYLKGKEIEIPFPKYFNMFD